MIEPLPQTDEWLVNYYVEQVNEVRFYPESLFASARLIILATGILIHLTCYFLLPLSDFVPFIIGTNGCSG